MIVVSKKATSTIKNDSQQTDYSTVDSATHFGTTVLYCMLTNSTPIKKMKKKKSYPCHAMPSHTQYNADQIRSEQQNNRGTTEQNTSDK